MIGLRIQKKNLAAAFLGIVVVLVAIKVYNDEMDAVVTYAMPVNKKIIVIDAGHGGWDPGKVNDSGVLEKDVNLAVAEKLQELLELGGSVVYVTRTDDSALADSKNADMNARRTIADEADADIFISIHQNSYPNENVKGAQAFYYGDSENGKLLAEAIQEQFKTYLNKNNNRAAAANENYYVLRKTKATSVLIECGFLTNPNESRLLTDEQYQDKVAWTIYMGIINYFANEAVSNIDGN